MPDPTAGRTVRKTHRIRRITLLFDDKNGKYHVDLLECNRQILLSAGVKGENIALSDLCTMCCSDLLFSHRATKGRRGGMAAMMAVKGDV